MVNFEWWLLTRKNEPYMVIKKNHWSPLSKLCLGPQQRERYRSSALFCKVQPMSALRHCWNDLREALLSTKNENETRKFEKTKKSWTRTHLRSWIEKKNLKICKNWHCFWLKILCWILILKSWRSWFLRQKQGKKENVIGNF